MENFDLTRAKNALKNNKNLTFACCKNAVCFTSEKRGVAPLLELIDNKVEIQGFSCADRVVGKGAALLYCVLKVDSVYAQVISKKAADIFEQNDINFYYETQVEYIINRKKTGQCPIESAVENISKPQLAVNAIRDVLKKLNN